MEIKQYKTMRSGHRIIVIKCKIIRFMSNTLRSNRIIYYYSAVKTIIIVTITITAHHLFYRKFLQTVVTLDIKLELSRWWLIIKLIADKITSIGEVKIVMTMF